MKTKAARIKDYVKSYCRLDSVNCVYSDALLRAVYTDPTCKGYYSNAKLSVTERKAISAVINTFAAAPEVSETPEPEAVPSIRENPIEFLGYIIGQSGNDGILLKKLHCTMSYEYHLGYHRSVDAAKRAAVLYFMLARPNTFAGCLVAIISDRVRAADLPIDYGRFYHAVKDAGLTMPEELTNGDGTPAPCKRVTASPGSSSSYATYGGTHLYYKGKVFYGSLDGEK